MENIICDYCQKSDNPVHQLADLTICSACRGILPYLQNIESMKKTYYLELKRDLERIKNSPPKRKKEAFDKFRKKYSDCKSTEQLLELFEECQK